MTVSEQSTITRHIANGTTATFAAGFAVASVSEINVYIGDILQPTAAWSYASGNVVLVATPPNGSVVSIQRTTTLERETSYTNKTNQFLPKVLDADLDRLWRALQDLRSNVSRALLLPISDTSNPAVVLAALRQLLIDFPAEVQARIAADDALRDLINDLVSDFGLENGSPDSYVVVKQPFVGSVARTQHDKNAEILSVTDFGAIGDGTLHTVLEWHTIGAVHYRGFANLAAVTAVYPHVTSSAQSIDWAATQQAVNVCAQRTLYVPRGVYVMTDTVNILSRINVMGDGFTADVALDQISLTNSGTIFLFVGTGTKTKTVKGVTDGRVNGGVIDNSADADFGATDSKFSLANYYNNDATSENAATPALQSVGFYIGYGISGCVLRDFQILLGFGGASVAGYINKVLTLADDWDIGLYVDNSRNNMFTNVQVLGYWRKNGMLIRSGAMGGEDFPYGQKYAGAEENKFYNCVFQGWKSVGVRSVDMHRVMAITSTYIEVMWSDNHIFDTTFSIRSGEFSTRSIEISSKSKVGDKLRLMTTSDQTPFVAVGAVLSPSFLGNGVSGTVFRDCRMHGMAHTSGRRISDPAIVGAMPPSACMEVSGSRVRGVRIEGTKMQTVDDIGLHLHQCIDFFIGPGSRFEGTTPSANGAAGIRMITTQPFDAEARPFICRPAFRVHLGDMEQNGGDFTPTFGTRSPKFSTNGFWQPNFNGATFAQGGLWIGGANSFNYLSRYEVAGFTPNLSFENNGDLEVSRQVRECTYEIRGNWISIQLRLSALTDFTTASGAMRVSLSKAAIDVEGLDPVLTCTYQGITLPAGYTQLTAVIPRGAAYMEFVAIGSGQLPLKVQPEHLVSGAFVVLQVSGTYRFE